MFDPFKDFETAGYLRNIEGLKDLEEVKRQEHFFFESNLETALDFLHSCRGALEYEHFLEVHRILFGEFYPWAGNDRKMLDVGRIVGKGADLQFEVSESCQRAVQWGLDLGNDKSRIKARPGEVMGAFAWGHPFLDGNGRTMLLVHNELCHRAGFSINWMASSKEDYLAALTLELAKPIDQHLDAYLGRLINVVNPREDWVSKFKAIPGLDGLEFAQDNVAYQDDDPMANARYEEIRRSRNTGTSRDDIEGMSGQDPGTVSNATNSALARIKKAKK